MSLLRRAKTEQADRVAVLLDTNALRGAGWTEVLSSETKRLVRESPKDVEVVVAAAEVSRDERRYQMIDSALELARKARALEKTVGATIPDDDTVRTKVSGLIDAAFAEFKITVASLDYASVDLAAIVRDSVERAAPFEAGTEKGFRDRIFLETALQFVKANSAQASVIFIVTGDGRLFEAIAKAFKDPQVQAVKTVAEAITEIHATASQIQGAAALLTEADELFHSSLTQVALKRIRAEFAKELEGIHDFAPGIVSFDVRSTSLVGAGAELRAFVTELDLRSRIARTYDEHATDFEAEVATLSGLGASAIVFYEMRIDRFEVRWQARVDADGKLSAPQVDAVSYLGQARRA